MNKKNRNKLTEEMKGKMIRFALDTGMEIDSMNSYRELMNDDIESSIDRIKKECEYLLEKLKC